MFYILTEEEMSEKDRVVEKRVLECVTQHTKEMSDFSNSFRQIRVTLIGEKCIHTKNRELSSLRDRYSYCDECPLSNIRHACNLSKEWSK